MPRFCDSDAFARRSRSYKWDDASLHGEISLLPICRCFDIGGSVSGSRPIEPIPRVPNVGKYSHGSRQRRARVIVTETVIRKHVASIVLPKRSSSSPFFPFFFFFFLHHLTPSVFVEAQMRELLKAGSRELAGSKGADRKILSVGGCHPSYTSERLHGGVSMVSSDVYTTNERVREDEGTNVTKRRYFIEGARRPDR